MLHNVFTAAEWGPSANKRTFWGYVSNKEDEVKTVFKNISPDDGDISGLRNIDYSNDTVSIEKCGCALFTVPSWYEVGMDEFHPDLACCEYSIKTPDDGQ